jgi:hypothetical protein
MAPTLGLLSRWRHKRDRRDGMILRLANRLWSQDGESFTAEFLRTLEERYYAPLRRNGGRRRHRRDWAERVIDRRTRTEPRHDPQILVTSVPGAAVARTQSDAAARKSGTANAVDAS